MDKVSIAHALSFKTMVISLKPLWLFEGRRQQKKSKTGVSTKKTNILQNFSVSKNLRLFVITDKV